MHTHSYSWNYRNGPQATSGSFRPPQAATGMLLGCYVYPHRGLINYREGACKMDAHFSVVIILNLPFSLTRSRAE